jgi:signal transduction histidine kinase
MGTAGASVGQLASPLVLRRAGLPVAIAATGAATVLAAVMGANAATADVALVAIARALMVGVPLGVGLYAWQHHHGDRFGALLMLTGAACLLTTLAESRDDLQYTVGRSAGWLMAVLLAYLILAYPSGRLSGRTDRRLVAAMAAVVGVFFVPRLALDPHLQTPNPFTSCVEGCPQNAFFLLGQEPWVVHSLVAPAGLLLTALVMAAVAVRILQRTASATRLARRMYLPLVVVSAAHATLVAMLAASRTLGAPDEPLQVVAWLIALSIPGIALAFLIGLVRWRLFVARALERIAASLDATPDTPTLRAVLADAFDDPAIEIAFQPPGGGGWIDHAGRPLASPAAGQGRCLTPVRDGGARVAAIVHDEALRAEPDLLAAGTAITASVLAHSRLVAESGTVLREVQRSRARLTSGIERERRRIERELHDGANQRLVALRIALPLTADLVREDPLRGIARLRDLQDEVEDALEEVRSVAHGVYPPLLVDHGIVEALRVRAGRSPVAVELRAGGIGRQPPEIECAVYFCVLEALGNIEDHGDTVGRAIVHLDRGGAALRFVVRDEARNGGGVPVHSAESLESMRDRLTVVGGELLAGTDRRSGSVLRGRVPLA